MKKYSSFKTPRSLVLAIAVSIALTATSSWASDDHKTRTCSKIASTAFNACGHDVRDDYWTRIGNCLNTDDRLDKRSCSRDARIELRDDRALCREQKHARRDICDAIGEEAYNPEINPANFLTPAETAANPNPYFPLIPGQVRILKNGNETITVTVTDESTEILGVTCTVIHDVVTVDGETIEDTLDWYAQDIEGNVWYFGELSKSFEDGLLDNLDGSWKAGSNDAQPGIIMKASPAVGDIYRQEFALGEAEDMAEVLETGHTRESAPAADCSGGCVVTRDFTPIEPEVEELKYFAPGIGNILVIDAATGDREELVDVVMP